MDAVAEQELISLPPLKPEAAMEILTHATSVKDMIDRLAPYPQIDPPVTHIFTPGLYTRQIFMPAGSLIISKIHKHRHPYVISKGRCSVFTYADGWVTLEAPHTGITEPGTQRVLLIHEDTIWTTFHVTDETDLERIEEHVIAKSMEECAAFLESQKEVAALGG
jgi:hypothetical protein